MSKKRVLVIDDEVAIRDVIQGCLEDIAGWEVMLAESGEVGLQRAATDLPDGILLDISMPRMNGVETFQKLQANPATQPIPVALLTARVEPGDGMRFAQLGIAGVIMKPFNPMNLVEQIVILFGWKPEDIHSSY